MTTAVSINISMPRADIGLAKTIANRMGWTFNEISATDSLFDPETGSFLNEETMQAIRDVEEGKVTRCKNIDEILSVL